MKDAQTIKTRLSNIQGYFNPEKNTYKVIEYVVNNDLNYNEMLMELSKIRGFSKYPEDLKNEYVSIINDIKENIINQRRQEEMERQKANTQELKDIIDSLEKTRIQYIAKQNDDAVDVLDVQDNSSSEDVVPTYNNEQEEVPEIEKEEKKEVVEEKENKDEEGSAVPLKKSLVIAIVVVIVSIILLILFY